MLSLFVSGKARQVWSRLLVGRAERGRLIDLDPECIAFQSRIQVVVLRCSVIDSEARPEHGFSVECIRRPRQGNPWVKVHIAWVVQSRILWAGRRTDWARTGWHRIGIEGARTQADAMELIQIEDC